MRPAAALLATALTALALVGCSSRPAGDLPDCDPESVQARVELKVSGTGAGVVAVDLTIENTSTDWCQLDGYPTVHIIDATTSEAVGESATPMTDRPGGVVELAPGATAYALVEATKAMPEFPECDARPAEGMTVVLPGFTEAESLLIPSPVAQYCSLPELDTLLVSGFSLEPLEPHDSREADG